MTPRPTDEFDTNPLVRIPAVIRELQERQIPHRVIEAQSREADEIADWMESSFRFFGSQIKWSEVPDHQCVDWGKADDLIDSFEHMSADLKPNSLVFVTWADALCPTLELSLHDMRSIASPIFQADFDTWVICLSENWCFEVYHEGTLCFGRSPQQGPKRTAPSSVPV